MLRALPFLFYCFERLATQLRPDVRNHGAEIHPTWINHSFPLCDFKKKKDLQWGSLSAFFPSVLWKFLLTSLSSPAIHHVRAKLPARWALGTVTSPTWPSDRKTQQEPGLRYPCDRSVPFPASLRLFPSLFSYRLFLVVQWKNESKLTRKVLLTFRWISVASILVVKKTSVPSPLSFPWSITTYILVSDLERGWFALSYKLCLTRIFCINFNCQATKRNGYKMTT